MGTIVKDFFGITKTFGIIDIIDIIVVAFIIYYAIMLAKETRAMQLVKSIGFIFVTYFIASNLNMSTLEFFLRKILDVGIIVLVVLFQPELRRALERIGRSRIIDIGKSGLSSGRMDEMENLIDIICAGCNIIVKKGEGALIVMERDIKLGDIINTGTIIDAVPSAELIGNLFFHNSPLHDGAVIVRDNRVYAAGCYLPLSENLELDRDIGTRHRAAVGVSEVSDAVTIVVSEERGTVSIAAESKIVSGLNIQQLKKELSDRLIVQADSKKKSLWKFGDKK